MLAALAWRWSRALSGCCVRLRARHDERHRGAHEDRHQRARHHLHARCDVAVSHHQRAVPPRAQAQTVTLELFSDPVRRRGPMLPGLGERVPSVSCGLCGGATASRSGAVDRMSGGMIRKCIHSSYPQHLLVLGDLPTGGPQRAVLGGVGVQRVTARADGSAMSSIANVIVAIARGRHGSIDRRNGRAPEWSPA